MSEIDRIAHLETVVRALYREVGELRAEIAALRGETVVARPAGAPDGGGAPAAQVDQDETSRTRDLSPPIAPAPTIT